MIHLAEHGLTIFHSPLGSILPIILVIHEFGGFLAIAAQDTHGHLKGIYYFPAEKISGKNRARQFQATSLPSIAHFKFSCLASCMAPVTWSSPATLSFLPSLLVNSKVCAQINYSVSWRVKKKKRVCSLPGSPNSTWFSLETMPFIATRAQVGQHS